MEPFHTLTSRALTIPRANIDTDQIIPGRFLTLDANTHLGDKLFYDWRYDADGKSLSDVAINKIDPSTTRILIAGENFGCGSSREHAVWALTDFGFRAIIAPSFADIFFNNALNNGLLPIGTDAQTIEILRKSPDTKITIDLANCRFEAPEIGVKTFELDPHSKHLLMTGMDNLEFLLRQDAEISKHERNRRSVG